MDGWITMGLAAGANGWVDAQATAIEETNTTQVAVRFMSQNLRYNRIPRTDLR